ncbi:hypothetical protein XELAEV_18005494mg [Xenopus laevis]|uniref:Uncharacterized protein n=1 Tax=Xenopus laevis TaxID=8355 RepID=A0A974DZB8_XENLA|nr:hypothetical protein XELAEV_18005494mg [Xenopus laevis]
MGEIGKVSLEKKNQTFASFDLIEGFFDNSALKLEKEILNLLHLFTDATRKRMCLYWIQKEVSALKEDLSLSQLCLQEAFRFHFETEKSSCSFHCLWSRYLDLFEKPKKELLT